MIQHELSEIFYVLNHFILPESPLGNNDSFENKEKEYVIKLSVPGFKKSEIVVEGYRNRLEIKIKRGDLSFLTQTLEYYPDADYEKTSAKVDLGILTLTIPKRKERKTTIRIT